MQKKTTSFLLAILLVVSVFTVTGCKISIGLNTLPTPSNVQYNDESNTVSWATIDNASGYYVQINDNNTVGKLDGNSYVIPNTLFKDNATFTVSVKACGDGILYSDSAWSSPMPFNYIKKVQTDYLDTYYSLGLGRSINFITASNYEPIAGSKSVFDKDKLSAQKPMMYQTLSTYGYETSAKDISEFMSKITANASQKLSSTTSASTGLVRLFCFSASISSKLDTNSGYTKQYESQSDQFYYHKEHIIKAKTLSLPNYNDTRLYAEMLDAQFLADAKMVNAGTMTPQAFINLYGTHVMMGVNLGGVLYIDYQEITERNASNSERYANITAGMSTSISAGITLNGLSAGAGDSSNVETSNDISSLNSAISSNKASSFSIKSLGGEPKDICNSMTEFAQTYKGWAETVKEGNYAVIDVPNNSMFCVWDYLDDSEYSNAKQILNEYIKEQSEIQEALFENKFAQYVLKENYIYDDETKILTVDMSSCQESGMIEENHLNTFNYKDNVLTLYPGINGNDVEKIKIIGGYKTKNSNNEVITEVINNFAIKFDDDWDGEVELILENVGLIGNGSIPLIDASEVKDSCKIKLTIIGDNVLDNGSNSLENPAPNVKVKDLEILGDGSLAVHGANGVDGVENGENGQDGGVAIEADDLTVNMEGALTVAGGNGGNGADGVGDGINGAHGGNGNVAISVLKTLNIVDGTIAISGGFGGNGGHGSARTSHPAKHGDVSWVNSRGPTGTEGYVGGYGGHGGDSGSCLLVLNFNVEEKSNLILIEANSGNGGNGGAGGSGGIGGENHWWAGGGYGGHGGAGGAGGDGGNAGIIKNVLIINNIAVDEYTNIEIQRLSIDKYSQGGTGGTGGEGGAGAWGYAGSGSQGAKGNDGKDGSGYIDGEYK